MELAEVLIVEAKQYLDGNLRLVTPLLFGFTEQARAVKKTVTITKSSHRRKWDQASFFEEAGKQLTDSQVGVLQQIYDFSKAKWSEVFWGTGATRGSFNPKFNHISNKSLYSVYSDGSLSLNFGWLDDEKSSRYRDTLKSEFPRITGLSFSSNSPYPSVPITQWGKVVEKVIEALTQVIDS